MQMVVKFQFNIRPEQFNFLFFEPAELRFSKIEKKKSIQKLKIKKGLRIFPFKLFFLYLCIFQDEICVFNFDRKPVQATAALDTHA